MFEVRISYKPGVQDAEGESTLQGLKILGFKKVRGVRTSKVYRIEGDYSKKDIEEMCRRLLANPVSQDYEIVEVRERK
ncbi:MAG: phosphoribosylformylglycinamidine synthase subunit PurS [Methanobacteriota archaeon]|jgi:phosphoribosylformylglycinamidine synthase